MIGFLVFAAVAPVAAADVAPHADLTLLPLHIPGYDLRVLDHRKPLALEASGARFTVDLPIFVYYPAPDRRQAARLLRQAADELRQIVREPDRNEADLAGLLQRLEHALDLLGSP